MIASYDEIYSRFLSRIEDFKLLNLDESDLRAILNSWMQAAISKPYVRRIFSVLSLDDEIGELAYQLAHPSKNDEVGDCDYVMEIISAGMVIEWLEPQVRSVVNIAQVFGSNKESRFYAQANHLSTLKDMLSEARIEQRKLIRDRGYIYNSYLDGDDNGS